MAPFSGLSSSLDEDLDDPELDCSYSSICMKDELSPSFCLPLDFLEEALSVDFLLSSSNCASICLRVSIVLVERESYRIVPSGPGLTVQSAWPFPQEYLSCTQRLPSLWKSSRPAIL